jgi:hypothetical protein
MFIAAPVLVVVLILVAVLVPAIERFRQQLRGGDSERAVRIAPDGPR